MFSIGLTSVGDFTDKDLKRELDLMLPAAVKRAEYSAVNLTIRNTNTRIAREVRKDIGLKSKTIKDSLGVKKATRAKREGQIIVSPKPVSMKEFGARQIKSGVSATILRKKGRTRIPGAFIVKSLGGHVFRRVGDARGPIEKIWGPSVRLNVQKRKPELDKFIAEAMDKNMKERLRWEIEKARRKR